MNKIRLGKTILLLIILQHCNYLLQAQSAKDNFNQAALAYDAAKYTDALYYLGEAERSLGNKINSKIQSLKIYCYYEQHNYENALVELARYFKTVPSSLQSSDGYNDMLRLKEELEQINKTEYEKRKRQLEQQQQEELEALNKARKNRIEYADYILAKESGSLKALKDFRSKYSTSDKITEINRLIKDFTLEKDFTGYILKGDIGMVAAEWQKAIDAYTLAVELKKDRSVTEKLKTATVFLYKEFMFKGDENYKKKYWDNAVNNYNKALNVKATSDAEFKLNNAKDNQAYYKATVSNAVEDYEAYIAEFYNGLYLKTAQKFLIERYLKLAENGRTAGNTSAVGSNLDAAFRFSKSNVWPAYKSRYYGIMLKEASRLTRGNKQTRTENLYIAIKYYETINEEYSAKYSEKIKELKRKETRWYRKDYSFMGWHADEKNLAGLMFGGLKNRKVGTYLSARTGDGIFETDADWETDNNNTINSTDTKKTFTGKIKSKTVYATLGITKKIVHPLWLYIGAGVCVNSQIKQFEHNTTKQMEYAQNKDMKFTAANAEAGVYLKLGGFVLRYGINKPFNDKFTDAFVHHFGIGFSL